MGHVFFVLVLSVLASKAAERWEVLPPTPAPIKSERSGQASASGISIYYAVYGQGPPVILLHGGLANADYWGNQIKALAPYHTVIVMDSRGHGRSTRDSRPYGYCREAAEIFMARIMKLRESVNIPTKRLRRPTFESAFICHSMASFWSENHQPLSNCNFPGVKPS